MPSLKPPGRFRWHSYKNYEYRSVAPALSKSKWHLVKFIGVLIVLIGEAETIRMFFQIGQLFLDNLSPFDGLFN